MKIAWKPVGASSLGRTCGWASGGGFSRNCEFSDRSGDPFVTVSRDSWLESDNDNELSSVVNITAGKGVRYAIVVVSDIAGGSKSEL